VSQNDRDTATDLENELGAIGEQLAHWTKVKEGAKAQVEQAKEKIEAAQEALADAADKGGSSAKWERRAAHDVIDTQTVRLEFAENRFKNAEAQLKSWAARKKDFPYAKLKELQKAFARRQKMGPASSRAYGSDSIVKLSGGQGRS
jgi:chromosome segregation ATPase